MAQAIMRIPPIFMDLIESPQYRYKCYYGGRGGGKSESIGRALLILASKSKKRILCTREVQNSIKDSVYKLLVDLIKLYKLPCFTITQETIKHLNGSEFIFKGLYNNTDSLKSLHDIDIAWVEEAQTITKYSLDLFLPSIRANNSQIWFSFNRITKNDPVWTDLCANPSGNTLVKNVNWNDNPYFPQVLDDERLRCLKYKPDDYAHIWEGEPEDTLNCSVVKYFTKENIKKINYQPEMDLHLTCDFNVDPMMWALAHKTANKIFFFDEIVIENTTSRLAIQEFINRYKGHKGKIIINGDASGDSRSTQSEFSNYATIINELCNHFPSDNVTVKIRRKNPPITSRVNAFNNRVQTDGGTRCLFIDPKCKWILYNIENLKYKEGTKIIDTPVFNHIKKNKESKFLSHMFDAVSYLTEQYWPVDIERPEPTKKVKIKTQNTFGKDVYR